MYNNYYPFGLNINFYLNMKKSNKNKFMHKS